MLRVGTAAVQAAYHRCLVTPGHFRRIEVTITDLDGTVLRNATSEVGDVLSGSEVDYDAKRIPTRILTLNLLDRSGAVSLDRSHMVNVVDSRYVTELGRWVDVDVFTGIVQPESSRNGATLRIVAHGVEVQAMGAMWKRRVFHKKTRKTWIIKELLGEAGESHLGGIPDRERTIRRRLVVGHLQAPWPKARKLAASMNDVLFYDGRGRPVLRKRRQKPVLVLDGKRPSDARTYFPAMCSDMEIGTESEVGPNTFEVVGKDPKGSKKAPRAVVKFPPSHPNSPRSLARGGKHFHVVRSEEREHAKTKAECLAIAKRWRREAMKQTTTFGFECLPIPHLEEYDTVRVRTMSGSFTVQMKQWVLPLYDDGAPTMRVGSEKVREAR